MINHQVRISQLNRSAMLQTFKPQYIDLDKFMEKSHIKCRMEIKKNMNCKSSHAIKLYLDKHK